MNSALVQFFFVLIAVHCYCKRPLWPQVFSFDFLVFKQLLRVSYLPGILKKTMQLYHPFADNLFLCCFFHTHTVFGQINIVCCQLCLMHLDTKDSRSWASGLVISASYPSSTYSGKKKSDLFGVFFLAFDGWSELMFKTKHAMITAHTEPSFLITAQCLTCMPGKTDLS